MKGILHPSVDYFYLLLCKVKSPAFYAVAALYLTVSFLAKKFTLERGKYLLSTWGNPLEYEKKLRVNVVNAVGKAVGSLAAITVIVIRRDRRLEFSTQFFVFFYWSSRWPSCWQIDLPFNAIFSSLIFCTFSFNYNMISHF